MEHTVTIDFDEPSDTYFDEPSDTYFDDPSDYHDEPTDSFETPEPAEIESFLAVARAAREERIRAFWRRLGRVDDE